MRIIKKHIIHCTATPENREVTIEEVTMWHKQRGFKNIGYHYLIHLNGSISRGRPLEEAGAHTLGHNHDSVGTAYVGGLDKYGNPKDTRTDAQKKTIRMIDDFLKDNHPGMTTHGHYEFVNKSCPSFKIEDL